MFSTLSLSSTFLSGVHPRETDCTSFVPDDTGSFLLLVQRLELVTSHQRRRNELLVGSSNIRMSFFAFRARSILGDKFIISSRLRIVFGVFGRSFNVAD